MSFQPSSLVRDPAAQLNFEALALRTPRIEGPYDTGVSATLTPDNEQAIGVTHNLALANTARVVVLGHLYDGSWASLASWRTASISANSVTINIGNPSGRTNVQAGLRFYLLIPRT